MTPSPQIERPTPRVATNTIPLAGEAPRRQAPGQRAKGANHRAVNPLVRGAFYVFIFSLLFEWPERPIPMEIPTLIGFIYLAFTLLQPKVLYRYFPKELWFYAVYVLFLALLCGFVKWQEDAIRLLTLMVQIFFLMWSGYNLMRYERIMKTALITLVISCSALSVMQLLGVAATQWEFYDAGSRTSVLGQNPNNMANNISLGLVALMGFAFGRNKTSRRARYIAAPLAAIMVGAIIDTGSRGAVIALGIGFAAFTVRGKTLWAKAKSLVIVLAILGVLVCAVLLTPSLVSRYEQTLNGNQMSGRENIFPTAWGMFKDKPFIGWGPIDNKYELGRRLQIMYGGPVSPDGSKDTHNMLLEILTSTGLFGTVPLLICIILCLLAAWRARRGSQGALPIVMVITVILINMSGNWSASKLDWLMMACALASANPLLAVRPRLAAANPTSPPRSPHATPAHVTQGQVGRASSATNAYRRRSLWRNSA
jgi:O-antigen ligase